MPVSGVRLTRSRNAAGEVVVRLGVPLLDEYLEFLAGRCRPNTVLAVAYDLKVFFTVVGKPPRRVRPVDVLAFMTAQRTGGEGRLQVAEPGGDGVSCAGGGGGAGVWAGACAPALALASAITSDARRLADEERLIIDRPLRVVMSGTSRFARRWVARLRTRKGRSTGFPGSSRRR